MHRIDIDVESFDDCLVLWRSNEMRVMLSVRRCSMTNDGGVVSAESDEYHLSTSVSMKILSWVRSLKR